MHFIQVLLQQQRRTLKSCCFIVTNCFSDTKIEKLSEVKCDGQCQTVVKEHQKLNREWTITAGCVRLISKTLLIRYYILHYETPNEQLCDTCLSYRRNTTSLRAVKRLKTVKTNSSFATAMKSSFRLAKSYIFSSSFPGSAREDRQTIPNRTFTSPIFCNLNSTLFLSLAFSVKIPNTMNLVIKVNKYIYHFNRFGALFEVIIRIINNRRTLEYSFQLS